MMQPLLPVGPTPFLYALDLLGGESSPSAARC